MGKESHRKTGAGRDQTQGEWRQEESKMKGKEGGREDGERGEMIQTKRTGEDERKEQQGQRQREAERRTAGHRRPPLQGEEQEARSPPGPAGVLLTPFSRPCLCSDGGGRPWPQTVHAAPFRPQLLTPNQHGQTLFSHSLAGGGRPRGPP